VAGDWMKIELDLSDKPEVHYIASVVNLDPDAVVGKLFRVWAWFDKHTHDGQAFGISIALIDRLVGANGFAEAMQFAGWLEQRDKNLVLPNFEKHNGLTAKKRAETNARVARHRIKRNADVTQKKLIPRPLRNDVMMRDKETCQYCGRKRGEYAPPEVAGDAAMAVDHVVPECRGGLTEINNLVCACTSCNQFKGDRTPDECNLKWPLDETGMKRGCNEKRVTKTLPREEKRRVHTPDDLPERFSAFWESYPKKVAKPDAIQAWRRLKLENGAYEHIMHALEQQKDSPEWRKENGRYIPHPATWLNKRRFEDENPSPVSIEGRLPI
jgi:5-methylcytosine-specific restriction endonuclease McrA